VVRVEILCRNPTKILAGRLFNFHGKLFQLQFTAEIPSASGIQREVIAGKDDSNAGGGPGSGTNGMDTDGRSEQTGTIQTHNPLEAPTNRLDLVLAFMGDKSQLM
jgi:hypothetical protein